MLYFTEPVYFLKEREINFLMHKHIMKSPTSSVFFNTGYQPAQMQANMNTVHVAR